MSSTTVIVGGGMAGAILARRLVDQANGSVVLIEAGPDYGPHGSPNWPEPLVDVTVMPVETHSWHYVSSAQNGQPMLDLPRAKVIGGCTSHNGCAAIWGHGSDYEFGMPGWDRVTLELCLQRATKQMRVWQPGYQSLTPWHRAVLDSAPAAGYPIIADLNDLDLEFGLGAGALNAVDSTRWNVAFAYLDEIRDSPRLTIVADSLVDKVVIDRGKATGVECIQFGNRTTITGDRIILAGGAYGSPAVLMRSGVGPADDLRTMRITVKQDLSGVGRNLQDHPAIAVRYIPTVEGVRQMDAFVAEGGLPREEGTIALARSKRCTDEPFDLHLYPVASPLWKKGGAGWDFVVASAVMAPRSVGTIRLASADPDVAPIIDHAYLTDEEGYDLDALADCVELSRDLVSHSPLASFIDRESSPGPTTSDREALLRWIPRNSAHDYHPTSSCRMGSASDLMAVVDERCQVHGVKNLLVCDAAVFPKVPKANTNIPVAAIAERLAELLA